MTEAASIRDILRNGTESLKAVSDTPSLDALVLLQTVSGMSREELLASLPDPVPLEAARDFIDLVGRRLRGAPVAYLTGSKEFYSRIFAVEPGVLVPRPDTEAVVDTALGLIAGDRSLLRVHDACTGSGCIAITIAAELARNDALLVSASDLSPAAERVFARNSLALLGRALPFTRSDFLSGIPGPFDLIVSNPPYLTASETAAYLSGGSPEPRIALDGGRDGLDAYRALVPRCVELLRKNGYAVFEIDSRRVEQVASICGESDLTVRRIVTDLGNRARALVVQKGTG